MGSSDRFHTPVRIDPPVPALGPREEAAVREVVSRVIEEVPAELVQAALFGSRARGDDRADSDIDVLLVFRRLPPDREPHAAHAEAIAAEVAAARQVPVNIWSVSLVDIEEGNRTPMLVDALADALPVWHQVGELPSVPFTPIDALRCGAALIDRVEEGSAEFAASLAAADNYRASRQARDDIVRLCTALLLLRGITRPRRAAAVKAAVELEFGPAGAPPEAASVLRWAAVSFGADGAEDELVVPPPPGGPDLVAAVIDLLRGRVAAASIRLERRLDGVHSPGPEGS